MSDTYVLLQHDGDLWDVLRGVEHGYTHSITHYVPYLTGLTADRAREIAEAMNVKRAKDLEEGL